MTVLEFIQALQRDVDALANGSHKGPFDVASALSEATPRELELISDYLWVLSLPKGKRAGIKGKLTLGRRG